MKMGRSSGVLLHPTSLPSSWGVGDLGPTAYRFVDLISSAKQSLWQILPLTPVGDHGSPYSPHSLFAGNPLLLSPERLVQDGYLNELPGATPVKDPAGVDYAKSLEFKEKVVESAFRFSFERTRSEAGFTEFCGVNAPWLDDFALYDALTREHGRPWVDWPEGVRRKEKGVLDVERTKLEEYVQRTKFSQFLFQQEWSSLMAYARAREVRILGDVPFYVLRDSSDIWAHPDLFKVGPDGRPFFVGGVPPDYFSKTGQLWGNPVYDWGRMEQTGYRWWKDRVKRGLTLADYLRLDHFRGYVAYWEIPAGSGTAQTGQWVPLPASFFNAVKAAFPDLPFVAEDLGVITDDVRSARDALGIPGMGVLQFAFDGHSDNPHLPTNHSKNSLVCTGTHDTNTTLGWFEDEATQREKEALQAYLKRTVTPGSVCSDFLGMAMGSVSDLCVVPLQDVLGLGGNSRMNNPGTPFGNWRWRALPADLSEDRFRKLEELTTSNGRG
ncbi:MAG TPA: 4-alpha-glucanotransferase [Nitrososphaerales archaeon]|nr:4-alpha-glucanotransferase [Nitrososphaerales archaeon]